VRQARRAGAGIEHRGVVTSASQFARNIGGTVGVSIAGAIFTAGVAAAEACGRGVQLKWPNDLILDDRKLGGILAEIRNEHALVGIGINLSWAPVGAAQLGADRDVLLDRLLPLMERWTGTEPAAIIQRWRELSWTLGQTVRVELGGEVIEGVAEDVAGDGALLVGGRRVIAGDVTRVRSA